MREIVLLGSTGSIGTQALDVIARNPGRFRVTGLAAGGGNVEVLARQAIEYDVDVVAVARASAAQELQLAFYAEAQRRGFAAGGHRIPKILAGPEAAAELATRQCDVVLNGITGSVGLAPTLAALRAGRTLALANKESLIVGGSLVTDLVNGLRDRLIPVDSEHSAIAQCLRAGQPHEVGRLVITASGGPFRGQTRAQLGGVTVEAALSHPTWDMGPVITINSATLVNKGLELIEAHLLFGVPFEKLQVVVHPQSLVHSMVEYVDGSTIAQVSPPDMCLAISLALGWPDRVPQAQQPMDWTKAQTLTFEPLDEAAFPAVQLAREVGIAGGTAPGVFNAANEEAVAAFIAGRLRFPEIVDTVAAVVAEHQPVRNSLTVDDVLDAEGWARRRARELTGLTAGVT
ncbi:MAG: 1-deoxy-D-xylulose-5-phosphate reductoisomerase [Actinomycetota bacterium]